MKNPTFHDVRARMEEENIPIPEGFNPIDTPESYNAMREYLFPQTDHEETEVATLELIEA